VSETAKPNPTSNNADFVASMKALNEALGSEDLAKQVFADANALDRQTLRSHFDARLEYAKQMAQISADTQKALEEQGRQTLKWLFLLNAGAIALVLTFAGSKAPELKAALVAALFRPILFFAVGCIFVVGAGAAGFSTFSMVSVLCRRPLRCINLLIQRTKVGRALGWRLKGKHLRNCVGE